jgi:hypothetical protein
MWRSMYHHYDHIAIARVVDRHAIELHNRVPHLEKDMKFGCVKSSRVDESGGVNDLRL